MRQNDEPRSQAARVSKSIGAISPAAAISLAIAVIGAAVFAALAFQVLLPPRYAYFGHDIYDKHYLAILEGRFDLPVRVLRYEGHYRTDGTGYLYHGAAPLLTRFAAGWLVLPRGLSLAPFSVWLWAVIGTAAYHLMFFGAAKQAWPEGERRAGIWAAVLAVAVWFGSPGILIATNVSLFHEPIAVAYAATGLFVLLYTRYALGPRPIRWLLVALALIAAITVHARPNLAIGLYLGTVIAAASALIRDRGAALVPALLSIFILGAGGLGFVGLNKLRFDSFTQTQGTFERSTSTYGVVFLGYEPFDSPRAKAIVEHGMLNAKRILPNGVLYAFDPPWVFARASAHALKMFRTATAPEIGYIRVDGPRIGFVFLWMGWCVLAFVGLFFSPANRRLWAVLATAATGAVVTLAFCDVTLRSSFDLWPLVAVLALSGLYFIVPRIAAAPLITARSLAFIGTIAAGLIFTAGTVVKYRDKTEEWPNGFFAHWTAEQCRHILVTYPRLSQERARALCDPPEDRR